MIGLSHVAVLVPSVQRSAEFLSKHSFQIGAAENFEGEGTLEIYVEIGKGNSLLLMEPIADGAYRRAFEKRGPGLHHLAIDVPNMESFLDSLGGSGWLLHPISIRTLQRLQTVYLSRPGFPALIEVHERPEIEPRPLFVDRVYLPLASDLTRLLPPIGLNDLVAPAADFGLSSAAFGWL